MRKILIALLSCVLFLHGCTNSKSLQEKFNTLKVLDYSEFSNMCIVNRKGVYFVTYQGMTYKIKSSFLTQKISSIEIAFSKEKGVLLTKKDTDYIEHALKSFDKIKVIALSVDEKGNVFLSLPWYNRCTYHFLRLSSSNTLENIKKLNYKAYDDNWYIDKECSER
ncbi:hypothetical protein [Bacteroides sedimenti]|uniref:Lipoprotein n=1 Tax=Bacteroides sedimenti TaxID=2136147 RepID=A0ABN6ZC74_9BACE